MIKPPNYVKSKENPMINLPKTKPLQQIHNLAKAATKWIFHLTLMCQLTLFF